MEPNVLVQRILLHQLKSSLSKRKVLVLLGSRRVGKTILLQQLLKDEKDYLLLNGEDVAVHELLARRSVQNYGNILEGKQLLVVDEAQEIPEVGAILKLIIDTIPQIKIVVTGSSAHALQHKLGAPLTGRQLVFTLYPLGEPELAPLEAPTARYDNLMRRLVHGNYPELLHLRTDNDKAAYLKELVNSYLFRDILAFENIRNSNKIANLLQLIAHQIGQEVSLQELGKQLGMSKNTVEKYLDILRNTFIIYRLDGFSRNLRKEISKSSRWYFMDNGIRNALIANLNPMALRNDKGQLWENYMVSERVKIQAYDNLLVNNYFWRTYDQQELDWVEERNGQLYAHEFKFGANRKAKCPVAWRKAYGETPFETISPDNFLDGFIASQGYSVTSP